jgi:hypothetical protein
MTMQKARYLTVASGLLTLGTTLWATGCGQFYEQCIVNGELCISHRTNDKPVCDGIPFDVDPATGNLKALDEACSVFAFSAFSDAPGSPPDGTKANPYKSLQEAVTQANGKWVIACSNAVFDESVTTVGNVQIYGGFSCGNLNWNRDETSKTALAPSNPKPNKDFNVIALTLQNGLPGTASAGQEINVILQDFAITTPTAYLLGSSSIGVVVDDKVFAEFVNCEVTVRDGWEGERAPMQPAAGIDGSSPMSAASSACFSVVQGGSGATTRCTDGESRGGDGGDGGDLKTGDGNGQLGQDGDDVDATHGAGGKGDVAGSGCKPGLPGADGTSGKDGLGGVEFGSLSLSGITGGDGKPGLDGSRGHGGGGGGGSAHGVFCSGTDGPGASGGAGGSGGCGGIGGGGGQAGGSSIGIISLSPKLKFTGVTLKTGGGGKGGDGANGTSGGPGALGGLGGAKGPDAGSLAGCDGGNGGTGGPGGSGGGGRGGHSIGVAFKTTPTVPLVISSSTMPSAFW